MFSYLDNPLQQTWLLILLLLWALLLFGGFIVGPKKDGRRMPAWTRLGSSVVLVVAASCWTLIGRDYGTAWYALLLAAGMISGFLGDLFLAKVIISGKAANLSGIAAFAVGHLFYISAIWRLGNDLGLTGTTVSRQRPDWLAACWRACGWYFVVYRGSQATPPHLGRSWPMPSCWRRSAGASRGPGAARTCLLALWQPAQPRFCPSDTLIGGDWFNAARSSPWIHDWLWSTYGPGQNVDCLFRLLRLIMLST